MAAGLTSWPTTVKKPISSQALRNTAAASWRRRSTTGITRKAYARSPSPVTLRGPTSPDRASARAGSVFGLVGREQRRLLVLPREQEEDQGCAEHDRDDAGEIRPLVAL